MNGPTTSARALAQPLPQGIGIPPAELGLWIFLGTVTMLFSAFFSAYLVRSASADWVAIELPAILWANSLILIASSITLERARRLAPKPGAPRWVVATVALGVVFLAGQIVGWQGLVSQGILIPSGPHSAFFYILTGLHAIHVLGGCCLLLWAARKARRPVSKQKADPLRLGATYWHFMGGLWLLVFLVLAVL